MLLIDIRMPTMNGFELYREIRKIDDKCSVCFTTAYETYYNEFARAFPEFDVRRFIRKPLTANELVARINTTLTKRIPV